MVKAAQSQEAPMVPQTFALSPEETALMVGDLSGLSINERASLIARICRSLGLNPLTKPFEYLVLDGKLTLYAKKDCTEQLRRLYSVNCEILSRQEVDGIYEVVVRATLPSGRFDEDMGAAAVVKEGGTWKQSQSGKRYLEKDGTFTHLAGDELINARKRALCVPLHSEILTRDGFKTYDQVAVGEEVLAYDKDTDTTLWEPLQNVTIYDSLPMVRLFSNTPANGFEATCTPDHSWAVRHYYNPRPVRRTRRGEKTGPKPRPRRELVEARNIKRDDAVIIAAPEVGSREEESLLSPVEAALLGWAVTDGSIKRVGNSVRIEIFQSTERNFPLIRELVTSAVGGEVTERVSPGRRRTFPSGNTYDTLDAHYWLIPAAVTRALLNKAGFHDRSDLPRIVTRLSPLARKAMLQAFMLAEGCQRGNFHNTDRNILDAFQLLCALDGVSTGIEQKQSTQSVIRMKKTRHSGALVLNLEKLPDAAAWCPTTAYGTWVMRQNGRVMITGNTQAKRRVTLSICGLGLLDDSDVEHIPNVTHIAEVPVELIEQHLEPTEPITGEDSSIPDYLPMPPAAYVPSAQVKELSKAVSARSIHTKIDPLHRLSNPLDLANESYYDVLLDRRALLEDTFAIELDPVPGLGELTVGGAENLYRSYADRFVAERKKSQDQEGRGSEG